jgi:CRISPR-associated protein Cas2
MSHRRRPWLICYDVADPRRLRRTFKTLRDIALPVQKSVFVAQLTQAELERLLVQLAEHIDPQEDRLQAFILQELAAPHSLGQPAANSTAWVV